MLQWDKKMIEQGKVKKGEKRTMSYTFTNISKKDIKIERCIACDCTTLDWTRKVVKPGETGKIDAIFNSAEKDEQETINITIILENRDPIMHYPVVDEVKFHFEIEK
jgi:peptidoglycan-associated lipoprotein